MTSDTHYQIDPDDDFRGLEQKSSASASPEIGPYRYHDDDSDPEDHDPVTDPVLQRFLDMVERFEPSRELVEPRAKGKNAEEPAANKREDDERETTNHDDPGRVVDESWPNQDQRWGSEAPSAFKRLGRRLRPWKLAAVQQNKEDKGRAEEGWRLRKEQEASAGSAAKQKEEEPRRVSKKGESPSQRTG